MRPRVAGGDRGLQSIRPERASERFSALQRRKAATDEELIPSCPVLLEKRDDLSRGARPRPRPRCLNLHQRDEAVDLRLLRNKPDEDAPQAQRLIAQLQPHPSLASGRRVTFVEDEIDDFENGGQADAELGCAGDFEGNMSFGQGPFGPDDSLRDGRLWDEERARDLAGRQTSKQPQRERRAGFGGKRRMAGREY